ncbi:MAG: hypothetical protein J5994_11410 [Ruminococcus sp.]|nr:hypothetical protein [Ruminococcus sp.]
MDNFEIVDGIKVVNSRNGTTVVDCSNMVFNTNLGKCKKPDDGSEGKYAALNYAKRIKTRAKKVKEICRNTFGIGKSMFLTLTFDPKMFNANDIKDIRFTHKEFKKFIKRVNGHYDGFKYVATFARQRNDNWHYHMICNLCTDKDIQALSDLWHYGTLFGKLIEDKKHYNNSINYLVKNMNSSAKELRGERGYLFSRNVERNEVITSWRIEDGEKYDETIEKIKQGYVIKQYETIHNVGIKKENIDTETGEYTVDIIMDTSLTEDYKERGYDEINSVNIYYRSSLKLADSFKPIETATPKAPKKKRRNNKKKRKSSKKK